MEYNQPSQIVKDLNFSDDAKSRVVLGVDKLAKAVKSTLGASGKCVIYEDAMGRPVITKDGVTVAESVVLYDPVENMGATLIKEASKNTVKEAGDGTTTAIVLAESLLKNVNNEENNKFSTREIKEGIESGLEKVKDYLNKTSTEVKSNLLEHVSSISCNNDKELGQIISEAYTKVGKDGIVLMEESGTDKTYIDLVEGVQFDSGLKSPHFITDKDKNRCVLEEPCVLIVDGKIPNLRKIQNILEYVIKGGRSLLVVAGIEQQLKSALLMNKTKGNIKVNVIDPPGFGPTRRQSIEDLALLTGATLVSEELGDDLDLLSPDVLGHIDKAVTDDTHSVLTIGKKPAKIKERIKEVKKQLKNEKDPFMKTKIEERLAMLSGSVGIVRVGANSKIELKEKKDRVEDAIYATKAALKEGIVPGGGIALLNAANSIKAENIGEKILAKAIKSPFTTIMANAGIENYEIPTTDGIGFNVISGNQVDMVKAGIVDPVLVTKTALKNAVSVVNTIISADCVISNVRINNESS
jgi:chaperonin GroEL